MSEGTFLTLQVVLALYNIYRDISVDSMKSNVHSRLLL